MSSLIEATLTELTRGQAEGGIRCFRCGECCIRYQVQFDSIEAGRVAGKLGISTDDFLKKYADKRWHLHDYLLRQNRGGCVFLRRPTTKTMSCSVHDVRFSPCRDWKPGIDRRDCRNGLLQKWGITLDETGRLSGSPLRIQRFYTFLKTLD